MDNYLDDLEQAEAIKRWWREYGRSIITGVVLGLVVLFGTRAWFQHRHEQARAASMLYAGLMQGLQSGKDDQVEADGAKLRKEFSSTPYAALGALAQAAVKVKAGDLKTAAADLRWALDNADEDGVKHIARLRLARVLAAEGKADEALSLLDKAKPGSFSATYEELKGDIYLAQGKQVQAREAYHGALAALEPHARLRRLLQMKLDDLASATGDEHTPVPPVPTDKGASDEKTGEKADSK